MLSLTLVLTTDTVAVYCILYKYLIALLMDNSNNVNFVKSVSLSSQQQQPPPSPLCLQLDIFVIILIYCDYREGYLANDAIKHTNMRMRMHRMFADGMYARAHTFRKIETRTHEKSINL